MIKKITPNQMIANIKSFNNNEDKRLNEALQLFNINIAESNYSLPSREAYYNGTDRRSMGD